MAKLYLNNKRRFYKARLNVGKEYRCMAYTPFLVLGYARFFRGDLIEKDKCYDTARKILDEVEGTGQHGALIGLTKFKPFIDTYIYSKIHRTENSLGYDVSTDDYDWEEEVDHAPLEYDEVGRVGVSELEETYEEARKSGERDVECIKDILSDMNSKVSSNNIIIDDGDVGTVKGKPI